MAPIVKQSSRTGIGWMFEGDSSPSGGVSVGAFGPSGPPESLGAPLNPHSTNPVEASGSASTVDSSAGQTRLTNLIRTVLRNSSTFWLVCMMLWMSFYVHAVQDTPKHAWVLLGYELLVPELLGGSKYLPTSAEFWGFIYIGIICYFWRLLSVQSCIAHKIQEFLYGYMGKWAIVLQWHTFFNFFVLWEINICLKSIWTYDWKGQPSLLFRMSSDHDPIPTWLWAVTSYAPFACVGTFIVITLHLFRLRFVLRKKYLIDFERFWKTDLVIVCIMLPSWFSSTALFAQTRLWQVVGGTMSPSASKMDYLSLFHADLTLAIFVELLTIFAFAKLTMNHIDKGKHERISLCLGLCNKPAVYWLTMNGVVVCVLAGILQSIFRIVALVNLQLIDRELVMADRLCYRDQLSDISMLLYCKLTEWTHKLDTFCSGGVLLCAYNMYFVCSLSEVQEELPRANWKFTGTRLIIMVAQIQSKVLMPTAITVHEYEAPFRGNLDGFMCALLHVSLMQYEVFLIALVQFFIWTDHFEKDKKELSQHDLLDESFDNPNDTWHLIQRTLKRMRTKRMLSTDGDDLSHRERGCCCW